MQILIKMPYVTGEAVPLLGVVDLSELAAAAVPGDAALAEHVFLDRCGFR